MAKHVLPLTKIRTNARFAIYSEAESLISEHDSAAQAMRNLCAHIEFNPKSAARIYERTVEGWEVIL